MTTSERPRRKSMTSVALSALTVTAAVSQPALVRGHGFPSRSARAIYQLLTPGIPPTRQIAPTPSRRRRQRSATLWHILQPRTCSSLSSQQPANHASTDLQTAAPSRALRLDVVVATHGSQTVDSSEIHGAVSRNTMSFALPESLRDYIDAQVRSGEYGNTSEYLPDVVRRDQHDQAPGELCELITESSSRAAAQPLQSAGITELGSRR